MQVLMKSFIVVSVCTQLHAPRPSSFKLQAQLACGPVQPVQDLSISKV